MKKDLLSRIAALALIGVASSAMAAPDKPNVILILGDDMGIDSVSAFNAKMGLKTPAIDQLAEEGMSFMDAHSTSAVCSATWLWITPSNWANSASQSMGTGGFDLHLSGRGYNSVYLGFRSRVLRRDAPPTFNWLNQLSNVGRDTFANYGILGLGGVSDNGLAYHFGLGGGWKRQVVVAADLRGGVLQGCAVFAEFGLGLAVGRGRR